MTYQAKKLDWPCGSEATKAIHYYTLESINPHNSFGQLMSARWDCMTFEALKKAY